MIKILIIIISLFLFLYFYELIQVFLLNNFIFMRGILGPNCFKYSLSEKLLSDGSGIKLFYNFKRKYGDISKTYMFGKKIYIIKNDKHIKYILDNSPYLFGPGHLKLKFFNIFMKGNIGIAKGCKWAKLRKLNESVLFSEKLHKYSSIINSDIENYLVKYKTNKYNFKYFKSMGKYFVSKIVFNEENIDDKILNIFSESNNVLLFYLNYNLDKKLLNDYRNFVLKHIENPNDKSLIYLCKKFQNDNSVFDLYHQVAHFIFPINGLFVTTIPRLLLILGNHKEILNKLINEINNLENINDVKQIYDLYYLRACILEVLRLNNPVVTTFRTVLKDLKIDNNNFKKNDQLLILNNPVLRNPKIFNNENRFIPERWNKILEKNYNSISFNLGPQICPAKELSIFIIQSFIVNFFKVNNILNRKSKLNLKKINTNYIQQMINPCNITIKLN